MTEFELCYDVYIAQYIHNMAAATLNIDNSDGQIQIMIWFKSGLNHM